MITRNSKLETVRLLFEIVYDDFFADLFENGFDKLHVQRVGLIIVLRFLVWKNQIERHLVGLVDDRSMAGSHFADVKVEQTRDRFEELMYALDQLVGGVGIGRVRPKNDDV